MFYLGGFAVATPRCAEDIASLGAAGLGHVGSEVRALLERQAHDHLEIEWRDATIEKLTFERAQLRPSRALGTTGSRRTSRSIG